MGEENRVKIGEVVGLKVQNCILRLNLLEHEATRLTTERDNLLKGELEKLGLNIQEYGFDIQSMEFVERKPQ